MGALRAGLKAGRFFPSPPYSCIIDMISYKATYISLQKVDIRTVIYGTSKVTLKPLMKSPPYNDLPLQQR